MAVEALRPIIGVEGAQAQIERIEPSPSAVTRIYRVRVELQLAALAGNWDRVEGLQGDAREWARASCAPALAWIADWAGAMRDASAGRAGDAVAAAVAATEALEEYGERYTAARLLLDLLPALEDGARARLAERASRRLSDLGARTSAAEAEALSG
jgi:hypothetical protein